MSWAFVVAISTLQLAEALRGPVGNVLNSEHATTSRTHPHLHDLSSAWHSLRPVLQTHRCLPPLLSESKDDSAMLPPPDDLNNEVLLSIVLQDMADEDVNELVWKYLGYEKDSASGCWDNSRVFPNWKSRYPDPPDLVGVTRTYSREVDEPVLQAVQSLQRSVPREHKDKLRPTLAPLGWKGFKLDGLTPNKTRRAQVATWLLYYRSALHGVPIDELKRRKAARAAAEEQATQAPTGTTKQSVI